jgi:predicted N-acetyltransferase YhbS
MSQLVDANRAVLPGILNDTYEIWNEGLDRTAYGRYYTAQLATAWGKSRLSRTALVDGGQVLASAKEYRFDAVLDGRPIRVLGIGAVFTPPPNRGRGHARDLLKRLLERAAGDGYDLALLFSEIAPGYYARLGFSPVERREVLLRVKEDDRRGAPATLVRAGEDRDLADIAAMNATRAEPFRFHLNRDRDWVQYSIAKRRLLAGLGPPGRREVHFFIAEEGASAVAYVVILAGRGAAADTVEWTIDQLGDRDPSGARVGAILQAMIAREPAERRPVIKAWLPADFLPPQIEAMSESKPLDVMMIKPLTIKGTPQTPLSARDVIYWHGDLF